MRRHGENRQRTRQAIPDVLELQAYPVLHGRERTFILLESADPLNGS